MGYGYMKKEGYEIMFESIGLLANPERADAIALAESAGDYLVKNHVKCVMLSGNDADTNTAADMIMTFGGDGTLLIGARYAAKYNIPLIGINRGTVGFLTEEEPERLQEALHRIMQGEYRIEDRMMLKVKNVQTDEEWDALNDVVITRGGYARLIRVECDVNGERFGVFTADGMIAATPTGSTGYSLSAGGPVVEPDMKCIVLTPVCAHSFQKCPCIVSDLADIRFRLLRDRSQTAELQIDGMNRGMLKAGDEIRVSGSDKRIHLLRLYPYRFYSLIRRKLQEWGF